MKVLGVDPGPLVCGIAIYDGEPQWGDNLDTEAAIGYVEASDAKIVIERPEAIGQKEKQTVIDSHVVAGRIFQAADRAVFVSRRLVTRHCGVAPFQKGNRDALVLQYLQRRFPKHRLGVRGGIVSHAVQALALAVCFADMDRVQSRRVE